jgi:hypothetical protein
MLFVKPIYLNSQAKKRALHHSSKSVQRSVHDEAHETVKVYTSINDRGESHHAEPVKG